MRSIHTHTEFSIISPSLHIHTTHTNHYPHLLLLYTMSTHTLLQVRESNARIVRWSDNTMSLYLGSEIFDIHKQPLQGEFSHLFVRQGIYMLLSVVDS